MYPAHLFMLALGLLISFCSNFLYANSSAQTFNDNHVIFESSEALGWSSQPSTPLESQGFCKGNILKPNLPSMPEDAAQLQAGKLQRLSSGDSLLRNGINLESNQQWLYASEAFISDNQATYIDLENIRFVNNFIYLHASEAEFYDMNLLYFFNGKAFLPNYPLWISFDKLYIEKEKEYTRTDNGHLTSCPPNAKAWEISAQTIEKDNQSIRMKQIVFFLKNIPIFYMPYMKIPMNDEAQTGFLDPGLSFSTQNGMSIQTPFYLHIQDNLDLTLYPQMMTNDWGALEAQARYLNDYGRFEMELGYFADQQLQDTDHFFANTFKHQGGKSLWNGYFYTETNHTFVSDLDYFNVFSSNLNTSDKEAPFESDWEAGWQNDQLNLRASYFTSQINSDDPNLDRYAITPEIRLKTTEHTWGILNYNIDTGAGYYIADNDQVTTRQYFQFNSGIELQPLDHVIFEYKLSTLLKSYQSNQVTHYQEQALIPIQTAKIAYEFYQYSYQSNWGHLFRPMLQARYVPYVEQNNPMIDGVTNHWNSFYSDSRFIGIDRIGDTAQVGWALQYDLIHHPSSNFYQFEASQHYYLKDRHLTSGLANSIKNETQLNQQALSPLNLKMSLGIGNHWLNSGALQDFQSPLHSYQFLYGYNQQDNYYHIGTFHRQFFDEQEFISQFLMGQRINESLTLNLGATYDIIGNKWRDSLLGLSYENCCLRIGGGVQSNQSFDNPNWEFFVIFELKGIGGLTSSRWRSLLTEKTFDSIMDY